MEISNPLAAQYISNQGLASQLNTQTSQLPVKSDRFSVEKKIPAPTDDEQTLRSQAEKRKRPSERINEDVIQNSLVKRDDEPTLPTYDNTNNNKENSQNLPNQYRAQNTELSPTAGTKQNNTNSAPIQQYLDTSKINSNTNTLSHIDFFV